MSKKSENLPIGPGSSPRESADYLNRAFASSDIAQICQAIGVVTHLHNISTIAKKAGIDQGSAYDAVRRCRARSIANARRQHWASRRGDRARTMPLSGPSQHFAPPRAVGR
jgi:hypothetical protein